MLVYIDTVSAVKSCALGGGPSLRSVPFIFFNLICANSDVLQQSGVFGLPRYRAHITNLHYKKLLGVLTKVLCVSEL